MGYKKIKPMLSPEEIKSRIPMTEELLATKAIRDQQLKEIFTGQSDRFIVIIGPCSADSEEPVMEYLYRLAKVNEKVKDRLMIVPRIYTNKPRTTGEGYKGMFHQPDPEKAPDMLEGVMAIRHLHIRSIAETGFTAADEMLYPENWQYLDDILSYVAIGARSVENQQHRLTVSGMNVPVGMKNPTGGDLTVMMNSVIAAHAKHTFIYGGWEVETEGNPLAHTILRGAVDKHGQNISNYHYEDLMHVQQMYEHLELSNPACIVDANHANSAKHWEQQPRIVKEVLHSRKFNSDLHSLVKGVMIESYLEDGNQKVGDGCFGKSITDPCLGWEKTEQLLYEIADLI